MPRVVIEYNPQYEEYAVCEVGKDFQVESDFQVIVDMKSSHYRNIKRNEERFDRDQAFLERFFIEAQEAGKPIRER